MKLERSFEYARVEYESVTSGVSPKFIRHSGRAGDS